jgi:hypothetical protein
MTDTGPQFNKTPLSEETHMDPAKHYIGESITAPSLEEVTFAGILTATGDSPIPARADHSHDFRTLFGGYRSDDFAVGYPIAAGGVDFIDDLVHVAGWGTDYLNPAAPNKVLDIPAAGVWEVTHNFAVFRDAGGFAATSQCRYDAFFNNAAVSRTIELNNYPQSRSQMHLTLVYKFYYDSVGATSNIQFRWTNGDAGSAVHFRTTLLDFRRISSFEGADSE